MRRGPEILVRRVLGPALGLWLAFSSRTVSAQTNEFPRLLVDRDQGTETCFPAERLRTAVAERLGYVPFAPDGRAVVEVHFYKGSPGWVATIGIFGPDGTLSGRRELRSAGPSCDELGMQVALGLSVALDRQSAPASVPSAPPGPPASVAPRSADPPPTPAPAAAPTGPQALAAAPVAEAKSAPVGAYFGAGFVGGALSAPSLSAGFLVEVGVRADAFSAGVEGRIDLPASPPTSEPSVRTSLALVSVLPCLIVWRTRRVEGSGCVVGSFGKLTGEGVRVDRSRKVDLFYASVGLRAALDMRIWEPLAAGVFLETSVPLTDPELTIDDVGVWKPGRAVISLGFRVRLRKP